MKISAKARYGLAAMISMAQNTTANPSMTLTSIANNLDISKIYLEHIFSLLKQHQLVTSIKGARGGYQLAQPAKMITVYTILFALENSLFENNEPTVEKSAQAIESALIEGIFTPLNTALQATLTHITLHDLVQLAETHQHEGYMYYL